MSYLTVILITSPLPFATASIDNVLQDRITEIAYLLAVIVLYFELANFAQWVKNMYK